MNNNNEQSYVSISDKILEKIEKEQIEPSSRLRLRIQNDGFWFLWLISIALGAGAVAGTLFVLFHTDWRHYDATYNSFFSFIFDTLPYLWFLTLLVFLLLAHQNLRHTKYGYRYPLTAIILLSALASIILGSCLYIIGLGQLVDEGVGRHIPLYTPVMTHQGLKWNDPENGLIAGKIVFVAPDFSSFELQTFDGQTWFVEGPDLLHIDKLILSDNDEVKVVGIPVISTSTATSIATSTSQINGLFHACLVLPWMKSVPQYENERNIPKERSNECKGVRPYQLLQELQH